MTRLVSGVILAVVALAAILWLPFVGLRLLAAIVSVLAAHEYLRIAGVPQSVPVLALVALTCWFVPASPVTVVPLLLLSFAWVGWTVLRDGAPIVQATAQFFAPWYIGLPLGMLLAVHARGGAAATLLVLATVVVSDSSQYYTGRAFGRRPLAPAISPKKTIEGALGGLVFGTLFLTLAGMRVLGGRPLALALTGVAVVLLGICGDLFESRLKRASGIKDSSSLIPGHGGVLDRIDAMLFVIPAFYAYFFGSSWW